MKNEIFRRSRAHRACWIAAVVAMVATVPHPSLAGSEADHYVPEAKGELRATTGDYPREGIVTNWDDFKEGLRKSLRASYKSADETPIGVTLQASLVWIGGSILSDCSSKSMAISPDQPLSGEEILEALPEKCFLRSGPGIKGQFITIGSERFVDGKPTNLGLWAKKLDRDAAFVIGIALVPTNERVRKLVVPIYEGYVLKYPIEHGI